MFMVRPKYFDKRTAEVDKRRVDARRRRCIPPLLQQGQVNERQTSKFWSITSARQLNLQGTWRMPMQFGRRVLLWALVRRAVWIPSGWRASLLLHISWTKKYEDEVRKMNISIRRPDSAWLPRVIMPNFLHPIIYPIQPLSTTSLLSFENSSEYNVAKRWE